MALATPVLVGMADIQVLKGQGQLSCLGLGSCIGLCLLDPTTKVAGVAHVMLPEAFKDRPVEQPGKFADTAVPKLLSMIEAAGANRSRLKIAIVGGAQVFRFGDGAAPRLDIGGRNTAAVLEHLKKMGLTPMAQETGGNHGRTMILTVETGVIRVRTAAQGERDLCRLA